MGWSGCSDMPIQVGVSNTSIAGVHLSTVTNFRNLLAETTGLASQIQASLRSSCFPPLTDRQCGQYSEFDPSPKSLHRQPKRLKQRGIPVAGRTCESLQRVTPLQDHTCGIPVTGCTCESLQRVTPLQDHTCGSLDTRTHHRFNRPN